MWRSTATTSQAHEGVLALPRRPDVIYTTKDSASHKFSATYSPVSAQQDVQTMHELTKEFIL